MVSPRPPACDAYAQLLFESFARVVGRPLCSPIAAPELAEHLWQMPQVLVSHGLGDEPLFNYGNAAGLALFEMLWPQFIATPSRESAEALNQDARAKIMNEVARRGFVEGYSGVRIAESGRRFRIENTVIWNVIDAGGAYSGQAATFARWTPLP